MSALSSFGKFLVGTLVGGAVGAAIGMLLAPRSGSETRALIREEFDQRYRDSSDAVREKSDVIKEKAAAFKDKMTELSDDLEKRGQDVMSRFTEGKPRSETTS
jgi:gas vesicle protein